MEPFRHLVRVTDGECVDDPVAGEERDLLREPREALRLLGQTYRLKHERGAIEISTLHFQIGPEHVAKVFQYPIVCGRGRSKEPKVRRQGAGNTFNQPVVRPEVVSPIRDAVRLVNHEQGNAASDLGKHLGPKAFVSKALGRNQEDVRLVVLEALHHRRPFVLVLGGHLQGTDSHPLGGRNLVSHERKQGRHEERWP